MDIQDILTIDRISCNQTVSSKKRALEVVCDLLAINQPILNENQIFYCMLERERLGTTGVGQGVAIPHSRLEGVEKAIVAVVTLEEPIEFDSPDGLPVDILFSLLVPLECTDEHLQILAKAAEMFSDPNLCNEIREARVPEDVFNTLVNHTPSKT